MAEPGLKVKLQPLDRALETQTLHDQGHGPKPVVIMKLAVKFQSRPAVILLMMQASRRSHTQAVNIAMNTLKPPDTLASSGSSSNEVCLHTSYRLVITLTMGLQAVRSSTLSSDPSFHPILHDGWLGWPLHDIYDTETWWSRLVSLRTSDVVITIGHLRDLQL